MFLVLALPVGSILLLLCYYIHNKICPDRIYAPYAIVRRVTPSIGFQAREKFAPGTLQLPLDSVAEKVEISDLREREKLRSVLQSILADIQDNYQQTDAVEMQLSTHLEEHERLLAIDERLDTEISAEEEYIELARKSLGELEYSQNSNPPAENNKAEHRLETVEEVESIQMGTTDVLKGEDNVLLRLTQRLHHAGEQLEKILSSTEDNSATVNAFAKKYSVLLEDSTCLQMLHDQSSQLYHAGEELSTKDRPNKVGLRRIVDIFKNRKSRTRNKVSTFSFGQNSFGSSLIS